jgi:endonuclease III
MSAKNRADLITKLHKFVKKEYQVITPPSNRSVLEHMIYGCCLENSNFDAADDAFAKLQENYFDWNEVRVTTVAELAESCRNLSDPTAAARSLKKTLHGIFEHYYQFDLDFLKKENLSKAVQTFQKFNGVSQFVVSYVAQNGLGGHSIPLDHSLMRLFYVLGIVTEDESKKDRVPGLERTIAKAKGAEFSILAHQLAVAFNSAPFSTALRAKILKVNRGAKERFPKRASRKKEPEKKAPAKKEPVKKVVKEVAKKAPAEAKPVAKKTAKKAKKKVVKKATTKPIKKTAAKPAKKAKVTKKVTKKKSPTKRLSKKKPR